MNLKFIIDVFYMFSNSAGRQKKIICNGSIAESFAELFQNFHFSFGKGNVFFVILIMSTKVHTKLKFFNRAVALYLDF